jgi:two-component system sensor histidine kinase/response regulator
MNNDMVTNADIPDILIVDDTPANLLLLGQILKDNGYKVRPVPSGSMALQVAEKEKPDLILLDIMMPEMDGFEVCSRLKKNEDLKDVPIIFISALNNTNDIVKAFKSGGADYINKPFQAEEVIARVTTHLKIYQQRKELQEINATKDKFFSIIAHDLRGPLSGFMSLTEMMADESFNLTSDEKKELTVDLSHSARNIYNLLENRKYLI